MKKTILLAFILTSSAFAGRIVPNVEWAGTAINLSGAATAHSDRNVAFGNIVKSEYDDGDEEETSTAGILGIYKTTEALNFEAYGSFTKYEYDEDDVDDEESKLMFVNVGRKLGTWGLGLRAAHINSDSGNSHLMEVSASKKIKSFLIGFGVDRQFSNNVDFESFEFFAGLGYILNVFTALLINHPKQRLYKMLLQSYLFPLRKLHLPYSSYPLIHKSHFDSFLHYLLIDHIDL